MKGVFVFNQLNDLIFVDIDEELTLFINKRAHDHKLITERQITGDVDTNVIVQLFAPLIASQRFMNDECQNPYHTIKCQNGLTHAFRQFGELITLAVGADSEDEQFLHRKLLVLHRILSFLRGPAIDSVQRAEAHEKKLLCDLLRRWSELYKTEQCFLVEAVERLAVNETLNSKCLSLLERTIQIMRAASSDKLVSHALILVGCKLMTLYSHRSTFDLESADILLIILLSNTLFPCQPEPEGSSCTGSKKTENAGKSQTSDLTRGFNRPPRDMKQDSGSGGYNTDTGVLSPGRMNSRHDNHESPGSPRAEEGLYQEWTVVDETAALHWDTSCSLQHADFSASLPAPHPRKPSRHGNPGDRPYGNSDSYRPLTAFLNTKLCCHHPVTLHVIHVLAGVTMVIVSEISRSNHAALLVSTLSGARSIRARVATSHKNPASNLGNLVNSVDASVRKFSDISKRNKDIVPVDRLVRDAHGKWELVKKTITQYNNESSTSTLQVRLDSVLCAFSESVKELFRAAFLIPRNVNPKAQQRELCGVHDVHKRAHTQLLDYREYLCIKALRNVTINSYIDDFPGLVHFIYVDRRYDYMTAPSLAFLGAGVNSSQTDAPRVVKDQVWRIVPDIQRKLSAGYTAITARDSSLYISYFLWHEDAMGNPLTAQQPYHGDLDRLVPGVLAGDFYSRLTRMCYPRATPQNAACCYELLCLHIGLVPAQYVLSHCRKMAASLWESAQGPII